MSESVVNKSFDKLCEQVQEARVARGTIVGEAMEVTKEIEQWSMGWMQ